MKKIFYLVFVLCLVSSLLIGCSEKQKETPSPASDFEYVKGDTFVVLQEYIGNDTRIIIPAEIEGLPVTRINSFFISNSNVEYVSLPDTVTKINLKAFFANEKLLEVHLGNAITEIDGGAFHYCTALKKINFPSSLKTIGVQAFRCCSSLEEVILPEGLESIGNYAFAECTSVKKVHIPKTVTHWGMFAFTANKSLLSLTFEDGIQTIGSMADFSGASMLESVTIPSSVTAIGDSVFADCAALKTVTFLGDAPENIGFEVFGKNESISVYYSKDALNWEDTPLNKYNLIEQ